jgi:hypothetical protein
LRIYYIILTVQKFEHNLVDLLYGSTDSKSNSLANFTGSEIMGKEREPASQFWTIPQAP